MILSKDDVEFITKIVSFYFNCLTNNDHGKKNLAMSRTVLNHYLNSLEAVDSSCMININEFLNEIHNNLPREYANSDFAILLKEKFENIETFLPKHTRLLINEIGDPIFKLSILSCVLSSLYHNITSSPLNTQNDNHLESRLEQAIKKISQLNVQYIINITNEIASIEKRYQQHRFRLLCASTSTLSLSIYIMGFILSPLAFLALSLVSSDPLQQIILMYGPLVRIFGINSTPLLTIIAATLGILAYMVYAKIPEKNHEMEVIRQRALNFINRVRQVGGQPEDASTPLAEQLAKLLVEAKNATHSIEQTKRATLPAHTLFHHPNRQISSPQTHQHGARYLRV